jgi:hypothetical protein
MLNEFVPTFTIWVGTHIFAASKYIYKTRALFLPFRHQPYSGVEHENLTLHIYTSWIPRKNK